MADKARISIDYLSRVVREESELSGAYPGDVFGGVTEAGLANVRQRIWYRIHLETGANAREIADACKYDPSTVYAGLRSQEHAWLTLEARLEAQYVPTLVECILSGEDPRTQADIAAWRGMGR